MSDHEEDMRMARENPKGFLEVHSDEELNSSFTLLGWQYLQIVDRARREIRARRDEIGGALDFWDLFDDGAEFGPDVPGPKVQVRVHADPQGWLRDDGSFTAMITPKELYAAVEMYEMYERLKKLGAEEAKDGD